MTLVTVTGKSGREFFMAALNISQGWDAEMKLREGKLGKKHNMIKTKCGALWNPGAVQR